jgi:phosphatidate cytidylyltransferase
VGFAALDAWYGFFLAMAPLGVVLVAAATIPLDRPAGYIQRTALGIFAFLLFGSGLLHLAYLANAVDYRPVLLLILIAVGLNDVFAFVVGKAIGGVKLVPATSPNKTAAGAIGAVVLTTAAVTLAAGPIFADTGMAGVVPRLGLGLVIAVVGQAGDLMLSSIKRDLGIKDTGTAIPGHGGLLDRCNSLLLVAPAAFHYLKVMQGIDIGRVARIVTGG